MFELAMREFGWQGYTRADLPDTIPEGLTDQSWHNDTCPSVGASYGDSIRVAAWIDLEDPARRDFPEGARYSVTFEHGAAGLDFMTVMQSESWLDVLAWFDVSDFNDAIARPIATHADLWRFIRALIAHNALFHFEDSPESIVWLSSVVKPEHLPELADRVAEAYALPGWSRSVCPIGMALDMIGIHND